MLQNLPCGLPQAQPLNLNHYQLRVSARKNGGKEKSPAATVRKPMLLAS
jgi:hypothetical protein